MVAKWAEKSIFEKMLLSARLVLTSAILILALLGLIGRIDIHRALDIQMPLMGVTELIHSIEKWKTRKLVAIIDLAIAVFIFAVCFIVFFVD